MKTRIVASHAVIVWLLLIIATGTHGITHRILGRSWWHHGCGCAARRSCHWIRRSTCCLLSSIQICFLLGFADIFLITNTFIAKPIGNLRDLKVTIIFNSYNNICSITYIFIWCLPWYHICVPILLWPLQRDRDYLNDCRSTHSIFPMPVC